MPPLALARTLALVVAFPITAIAQRQGPDLSAADSALIGRILWNAKGGRLRARLVPATQ